MAWVLSLLLLLTACATVAAALDDSRPSLVVSRHYHGDVFTAASRTDGCGAEFCLSRGGLPSTDGGCDCRCQEPFRTFREDTDTCVNTIPECRLADFSTGSTLEKLPFVFMPEPGSLVHPSAEITMADVTADQQPVVAPVCVVSGSQVVTGAGWRPLNHTFEPPFRLRRDHGKTFLQWVGRDIGADQVTGRIVLVKLLCKDAGNPRLERFSPCVAFRIAGTAGPDEGPAAGAGAVSDSSLAVGLSVSATVTLYLAAVAAYLAHRRRRHRRRRRGADRLIEDALMGKTSRSSLDGLSQQRPAARPSATGAEPTTTGSASSGALRPELGERAPEGGLSGLVHTSDTASDRRQQPGDREPQPQKKLYFTSDFFHPELLQDPPPAALEFVSRVREMMGVARQRLQTRQFQPSLPTIDERADEEAPASEPDTGEAAAVEAAEATSQAQAAQRVDIALWLESVARSPSWPKQLARPQTSPTRSSRSGASIESESWSESDTTESADSDDSLGGGGGSLGSPRGKAPPQWPVPVPPAAPDSLYEEIDVSDHSLSTLRGDVADSDSRSTPSAGALGPRTVANGPLGTGSGGEEPALDNSLESVDSAYQYWGSLSEASSSYSRINFVSGRSQPVEAASETSIAPRRLTTFSECSEARQQGVTVSLLDQWRRRRAEQTRSISPRSEVSSVSVPAAARSLELQSPEVSAVSTPRSEQRSPPVPPRAPIAAPEPARTPVPPLPPRTCGLRARPAPPPPPPGPERAANQPPLPPKRAPPPPPLPSKARGGPAVRAPRRQRQNSAGESETNSGGSSQDEESVGAVSSPVSRLSSSDASSVTSSAQTGGGTYLQRTMLPPGGNSVLSPHGWASSHRWEGSSVAGGRERATVDVHRVRQRWQKPSPKASVAPLSAHNWRPSSGRDKLKRLVEKFDIGDGAENGKLSLGRLQVAQ